MTAASRPISLLSIVLPSLAILVFGMGIAGEIGLLQQAAPSPDIALPNSVIIPGHRFIYRADGTYYKNGFEIDAPMVERAIDQPLTLMKYQVTEAEYGRCVADGACLPTSVADIHGADRPVTGVSWDDANAYARWLSGKTGQTWILPSQEQMAFAAGSKFPDDALGIDPDSRNPALRWLADYDRETRRKAASDPEPQLRGRYGENEYGLADFAGNVWEWTSSCARRVDITGRSESSISTCGVYVTVGQHRASMNSFVRDPKTGGCSVGAPPSNLGFRLIRDDRWYARLIDRLKRTGLLS